MGCKAGAIVAHLKLVDKVKKYYSILKNSGRVAPPTRRHRWGERLTKVQPPISSQGGPGGGPVSPGNLARVQGALGGHPIDLTSLEYLLEAAYHTSIRRQIHPIQAATLPTRNLNHSACLEQALPCYRPRFLRNVGISKSSVLKARG